MYFLVYNFICCIFEYNQTNKKKMKTINQLKKEITEFFENPNIHFWLSPKGNLQVSFEGKFIDYTILADKIKK